MIAPSRIPVYLLTGFLGSGKTTLLSAWLKQAALRDAVVIVNELGEVGLDGALLGVTDNSTLMSGSCVCCTGLPGLEQALEDLFWARLQRSMPAFPAVAIETTGMADPGPIVQAFQAHSLLRERYVLQTVITVAGASAGARLIDRHEEARAQVRAADVLVMTKTDLASKEQVEALSSRLAVLAPHQPVLVSNQADLPLEAVLRAMGERVNEVPAAPADSAHASTEGHDHEHGHDHRHHDHHHAAEAHFLPLPEAVERNWLLVRLHALAGALSDDLLRLKGRVTLAGGERCVIQFAPDDARFDLRPNALDSESGPDGLTVIALHTDLERLNAVFFGQNGTGCFQRG